MARKVYEGAKTHGDDSHLVQQMEAWLGLRSVRPLSHLTLSPHTQAPLTTDPILPPLLTIHRPPPTPPLPLSTARRPFRRTQQGPALEQAYYFYDELLQAPASARQPAILAAHGAAHFLLGHVDEAQADVEQAVEAAGGKANDGAVNALGAAAFGAERADEFYSYVFSLSPRHRSPSAAKSPIAQRDVH